MSNQINKVSPLGVFSWQLNAKKTFLDIAFGFPVIAKDRGGCFKKNLGNHHKRTCTEVSLKPE
jgi:hypothetical protein